MQSTWAASSETWSTTHVWANDTFTHSITASSTLGTNNSTTLSMPVSADITQILLSELHEEDRVALLDGTLASALGVSTSCTLVVPVSGSLSMSNTATGSSTHKAVGLATLGALVDTDSTAFTVFPATATFSSVLDNVNDEDKVTLINASFETNYGIISTSVLKAVGEVILQSNTGVVTNVNYPEAVTLSSEVSTSSASNFLWNEETESSDTWSETTETTTTWTEQTEDNTTWEQKPTQT